MFAGQTGLAARPFATPALDSPIPSTGKMKINASGMSAALQQAVSAVGAPLADAEQEGT